MAGVKTGKYGYVNGIPCVQTWGYNRTAEQEVYSASCTDFGTGVTSGVINESGIITGVGGNPPIVPGQELAFKGVADNTPGSAEAYDGTILILGLTIGASKETGSNITWSAPFGVQGQLTPGVVGAADATFALSEGAAAIADAQLFDAGANYVIPGFRAWEFTVNCPEKLFTINGLRHRRAGNMQATIGIDVFNSELRNVKYAANAIDKVKLFIDATNFWLFEWVRFSEQTGYTVNRGTQDLIGYRINGNWTAVSAGALGHITKPTGGHLFGV